MRIIFLGKVLILLIVSLFKTLELQTLVYLLGILYDKPIQCSVWFQSKRYKMKFWVFLEQIKVLNMWCADVINNPESIPSTTDKLKI